MVEAALDLPGEQDLAQLAGDRLLAGEEEVARDLHRDRAGALLRPGSEVGRGGPQHAQIVDAAVLIETLVLGRQNRLFHDIRDIGDVDHGAPLLAEFAEQVAFGRDDPQRDLGLVIGQRFQRRQRRVEQRQHERAEQRADDGEPEQHRARCRGASALA